MRSFSESVPYEFPLEQASYRLRGAARPADVGRDPTLAFPRALAARSKFPLPCVFALENALSLVVAAGRDAGVFVVAGRDAGVFVAAGRDAGVDAP